MYFKIVIKKIFFVKDNRSKKKVNGKLFFFSIYINSLKNKISLFLNLLNSFKIPFLYHEISLKWVTYKSRTNKNEIMHVIANVMYYQAPLLLFQAKQEDTMTSKWIITLWLLIEKWLLVILLELFWSYFSIMMTCVLQLSIWPV